VKDAAAPIRIPAVRRPVRHLSPTPAPTPRLTAARYRAVTARRVLRMKSALDQLLAAALLVLAAPVLLAAMAAVRATSRGPAIYTQTRLGRFGRVFTIYKLRTMCQDAESLTGPRWSLPGDPRITPVGHVLRALHIDELPQLWNVIKGEMSLVGPRPERPEIAADLRRAIPGYDRRLAVMPGLTGFAQIHLPPDETVGSVRRKLVYDLFYVRRFGLGFDLYILVCTAFKVVGLRWLYCRRPK
jgi:lipopolysaccharide/colanic/teichoic acid biosynthesis glycosyltransferase